MNYYRVVFAYDGLNFFGWQKQNGDVRTVEQAVCTSFAHVFGQPMEVAGASRTDAGVHACGQVARIVTPLDIAPERLQKAWNSAMPAGLMVRAVEKTDNQFHPRYNIVYKEYRYHIFTQPPASPFVYRYGWQLRKSIDNARLQEALALFVGQHDFAVFCSEPQRHLSTKKTIQSITLEEAQYPGAYRIVVRGHSFLRHMVRRIVGMCVWYASTPAADSAIIKQALENSQLDLEYRFTAPSHGLMLYTIMYHDRQKEEPHESFFIL